MDYEKKYKEALERARNGYVNSIEQGWTCDKAIYEEIFPELKESEDERIKKDIISFLQSKNGYMNPDEDWDFHNVWIPWLEKQGEQKPVWSEDDEKLIEEVANSLRKYSNYVQGGNSKSYILGLADSIESLQPQKPIISYNALREGIAHFGITQYQIDNWLKKYVDVEKQGEQESLCDKCKKENAFHSCQDITELGRCAVEHEQKPINKVEPKFKVGDWIASNLSHEDYRICKILKIENGNYTIESTYGYKGYNTFETFEKDYHLWTIQDAKEGDVLADSYAIIIFRKIGKYCLDDVVDFHICYSFEKGVIIQRHNLHCGSIDSVFFNPATKEQRDTLFQKMKEAGYEWVPDKLELKKIEC